MKIVVTGATGFLGSWVCRVLSENHSLTALIRPESNRKRLDGIENLDFVTATVDEWPEVINKAHPHALISMEWWGVDGKDRNNPNQKSNIKRSADLLERLNPIPLLVGTGSQAELGPVSNLIRESQPDSPTNEYGQSKVVTRSLFIEKALKSSTRFIWARIFSTYGPLDREDWLIPTTMRSLASGQEMRLTKGEQEWSYLHAYDLAKAFQTCIEHEELSGIVNIGNPITVRLKEVVMKIANLEGRPELLNFGSVPYRDDQVMRLAPICESLTSAGWTPKIDIDSGLEHLHNWLIEKRNSPLKLISGNLKEFNLPTNL